MTPLEKFRKDNYLTQLEVADFLGGINSSNISRIEAGRASLPLKHLIRLLENDKGWDVSALKDGEQEPIRQSAFPLEAASLNEKNELILRLQAEITSLKLKIETLTEERDRYWKIIETKLNAQ